MDKSKLIKEINKLHSLVKATRIHIIRKLVRDKKLWAAKATANSSNCRAKRKAETSEAILNHIKSIPLSVLTEQVLQYQPLKNGESLESAPLAHRSMARFLQDPKLTRYLKSLESQLGADANSKLLGALQQKRKIKSSVAKLQQKERIKKMLKNKKEKRKEKRKKNGKRTDPPKAKAEGTKPLENDEQDSSHGTDDEGNQTTLVCDSYESDDDSEELGEERVKSEDSEKAEESDEQERLSISVSEDEHDSSDEEPVDHCVEEPQIKTNGIEKRNDSPQLSKSSIKKPERSGKQVLKNPKKKKEVNYKAPEEEDDKDGYEMITDSFFVTDAGERYVAVAPKLKSQTDDDVESDDNKESWKIMNRRKRRDQEWEKTDNTEAFDTDLHQVKQRKVTHFTRGNFISNENLQKSGSLSVKNQDLHPSWAAKQAQKGIKPFAGKKVVFDAEEDSGQQSSFTQRTPFNGNLKTASDLHPSWAAKQAQKGIKPFAGKKVVFDAEDDGVSSSTCTQQAPAKFNTKNNDLHPSWAAKQAQKGIKPFAGKKIAFDAENTNDVGKTISKKSFDRTNDLHPSWAAKQAQNGIKSFTGKKTVFEDQGGNVGNTTNGKMRVAPNTTPKNDIHPSWAAKQAQKGFKPFAGKKITFDTDDADKRDKPVAQRPPSTSKGPKSTDLHPSWAAKQAQKAIVPFAGKKINFGNEDTAKNKTTATGSFGSSKSQPNNNASLHPSWAAKQAQSGIKPFAGTKISFDD